MKKVLHLSYLAGLLLIGLYTVSAQNNTYLHTAQAPNFDFELWDNTNKPWGWNTALESDFGNAPSAENRVANVFQSTDIRPGSDGKYSVLLKTTLSTFKSYRSWLPPNYTWSSKAPFGTMSTGKLFGYPNKDIDINHGETCAKTNTGDNSLRWAFTSRPDSLIVWVKLAENGGRKASVRAILHDNNNFEDRYPDGSANGSIIGQAVREIEYNGGKWQRVSVPFVYESSNVPNYLLLSFNTGTNMKNCVVDDQMWIDDLLFVYNPTVQANQTIYSVARQGLNAVSFNVDYSLSGTFNPFTLLPYNEVVVLLSDINGSFNNAIEIGRTASVESGTVTATVPENLPSGNRYKIKLQCTNPFIESPEYTLDLYSEYRVSISTPTPQKGTVNNSEFSIREYTSGRAEVLEVKKGNHFKYWTVNGDSVTSELQYNFIATQNMNIQAIFDTNLYRLEIVGNTGGKMDILSPLAWDGPLAHNTPVEIHSQAEEGYHFSHYLVNGNILQGNNFSTLLTEDLRIEGVFDTNEYLIRFKVIPEDRGHATNSGYYKHFSSVVSEMTPENNVLFKYWRDSATQKTISYEPTLSIDLVKGSAVYEAVTEDVFHSISTLADKGQMGRTEGDVSLSGFLVTESAWIEAIPHPHCVFSHWTYTVDGEVQNEELTEARYQVLDHQRIAHDYVFTAHFDSTLYTLELQGEHGKTTGSGSYRFGEEVAVHAIADSGYEFAGWQDALGNTLSTQAQTTLTISGNTTVKAVFSLKQYEVSIEVSSSEMGALAATSSTSGTYSHFDLLNLEATALDGYEFLCWVIGKDTIEDVPQIQWTVDRDLHITAHFVRLRKTLTLHAFPESYGNVYGDGRYPYGSTADIRAEAFYGYHFLYWANLSKDTLYESHTTLPAITEHSEWTAHFGINRYRCEVAQTTEGGNAFFVKDSGELTAATLDYLSLINFIATENNGYTFKGWINQHNDTLSKERIIQLSLVCDTLLTPLFELKKLDIRYNCQPSNAGIVEVIEGDFHYGSSLILHATPEEGYVFKNWSSLAEDLGSEDTLRIERIEKNGLYTANFELKQYQITVVSNSEEYGTVNGSGSYSYGKKAMLTATARPYYQFKAWVRGNDTLSYSTPYYPTVYHSDSIVGVFDKQTLKIAASPYNPVEGSVQLSSSNVIYLNEAEVEATPNYGYQFAYWATPDMEPISTENPFRFTGTQDTLIFAHFNKENFELQLHVNPEEGQVIGAGTHPYLSELKIEAIAAENFIFDCWKDAEGNVVSRQAKMMVTMDKPLSYTAQFSKKNYQFHLVLQPNVQAEYRLNGELCHFPIQSEYGKELNIEIKLPDGYCCSDEAIENADHSMLQLRHLLTRNDTLVLDLERCSYTLGTHVHSAGTGTVEGNKGSYTYGETACIEAVPAKGHVFKYFAKKESGKIVSYESPYTFPVTSDLEIEAFFDTKEYNIRLQSTVKDVVLSGMGNYLYGDSVEIQAISQHPALVFSHWTDEKGDTLSTSSITKIQVEDHAVFTAHFSTADYTLTITTQTPVGTMTQITSQHSYRASVNLTAGALKDLQFVGWQENDELISTKENLVVKMDRDREIYAAFDMIYHNIHLKSNIDDPIGIQIEGEGRYAQGTRVFIKVLYSPSYELVGWVDESGDTLSKESIHSFILEESMDITALLQPKQLHLVATVNPAQAGRIENLKEFYHPGDIVSLKAHSLIPDYQFMYWKSEDKILSLDSVCKFRIENDLQIEACYKMKEVEIWAQSSSISGGTVSGNKTYLYGDTVKLVAQPNTGYHFLYWTESGLVISTSEELEFTAKQNRKLLAHFEINSYQINVNANPSHSATVKGAGIYTAADTVFLQATAIDDYSFVAWMDGKDTLSYERNFRFLPTKNSNITALLTNEKIKIEVAAYPEEGGVVLGDGEYTYNTYVNLKASAQEGYYFDQWVDKDMRTVSKNPSFVLQANRNNIYTALFVKNLEGSSTTQNASLKLYPNPCTNRLNIEGFDLVDAKIYNSEGMLIQHIDLHSTKTTLDISKLSAGTYLYVIQQKNVEHPIKGKFVKR